MRTFLCTEDGWKTICYGLLWQDGYSITASCLTSFYAFSHLHLSDQSTDLMYIYRILVELPRGFKKASRKSTFAKMIHEVMKCSDVVGSARNSTWRINLGCPDNFCHT